MPAIARGQTAPPIELAATDGKKYSLQEALAVTPAQIYGHGACESNAQASCFDMNRWMTASGVSVPPFPLQNRPTFQQVVEYTSHR